MSDRLARTLPAGIDGHITAPEALPESDAEQSLKEPQETENRNLEKKDDIANSTQSSSAAAAGRCNGKEEFQYHYLTFDTPLPPPTGIAVPRPGQPRAPEQPDLRPYISPFTWRKSRKGVVTMLSCLVTTLSAMAAGAYSPPEQILIEKWRISGVVYNLGISVFSFGFALSPMVLAPFSEINGRRPMLVASGILFSVTQLGCAVTDSFAGMLLSRLFLGVGGSTFSSIIGGVLSDVYVTEERNTPMALFSGAVLFGTGFGPMVSSFIVHHTSWRWVYYLQTIMSAVVTAMVVVFFKETRGNLLLSRKAQALNRWYEQLEEAGYVGVDMTVLGKDGESERQSQRIRWKVKSDEERESIAKVLAISLYRPFHLLFTEPVVFFFSLWVSFSWAVLYLQFGAIPLVFQDNHGFNLLQSGAVFASISIGGIIATFLSIWQEKYVHRLGKISSRPEGRLVFVCVESILMPVGMFWFGWTSFPSIHWIVPCLAIGCVTIGIFSIYLAVFNYLADTYHRYASSALAAQSCCRNLLGGVFPLVVRIMYVNLGYPEASSLLGGIGSLLTIVPWVLVFYGPKIRARSKIASEILTKDERAG
ncbi:MFS multidrug transporter [Histoplasma ohiense]|nr:MFS multidrug transporter [Histoplasma ohiense (nom. inval.)]